MTFTHLLEMIRALFKGLQADFLEIQALNRMVLPCYHLLSMENVLSNLAIRGINLSLLILLIIFSGCTF